MPSKVLWGPTSQEVDEHRLLIASRESNSLFSFVSSCGLCFFFIKLTLPQPMSSFSSYFLPSPLSCWGRGTIKGFGGHWAASQVQHTIGCHFKYPLLSLFDLFSVQICPEEGLLLNFRGSWLKVLNVYEKNFLISLKQICKAQGFSVVLPVSL